MTDDEKVYWLFATVPMWSASLLVSTLAHFFAPEAIDAPEVVAITTVIWLPAYLLILSWRVAYLSGRKDKEETK